MRLASAEDKEVNFGFTSADDEEEEWDSRSLASVEGDESDNDSIESIECDDDALPFDKQLQFHIRQTEGMPNLLTLI